MSNHHNNSGDRARKVFNALDGEDEFSVFSVEPGARKPLVEIKAAEADNGRPEDTRASRSFVRFFRKIFGD